MDGGLTSKKGVMMMVYSEILLYKTIVNTVKAHRCSNVVLVGMVGAACDYKAVDHPIVSQHSRNACREEMIMCLWQMIGKETRYEKAEVQIVFSIYQRKT